MFMLYCELGTSAGFCSAAWEGASSCGTFSPAGEAEDEPSGACEGFGAEPEPVASGDEDEPGTCEPEGAGVPVGFAGGSVRAATIAAALSTVSFAPGRASAPPTSLSRLTKIRRVPSGRVAYPDSEMAVNSVPVFAATCPRAYLFASPPVSYTHLTLPTNREV